MAAAVKLDAHLNVTDFKGSDGWPWQFQNRHGLFNQVLHGAAGDADESSLAPFYEKLRKLINNKGLLLSQAYNADETGMLWRLLPKNTQVRQNEEKSAGKKMSKERLSVLIESNATGTHQLKFAVVGKSKKKQRNLND